ncbi:aromatic prenyltransferase [Colletotrichum tofieldiae]|uniref:Aromatic prenyltransferase n=1 Tax=Colletotrichum tofieldiae TaxID=708197 RepID=A0A161VYE0_9PEZI|nr:aromatic prenyltransferase [Colletotrichum tofieldiae]GKT65340.1 aromatic prenyltransferase [Colletotrichum tofieldiae]GKT76967.1 aromatic prenyltransferase [Colletotrichum tofieldiae]GKT92584.1 aromatic prenyltransferase [Colletotrichum tofieldiae]
METNNLNMENHHSTTAHHANGTTKRNIYNEVEHSTSSRGGPLVSSWLPTLYSTLSSLLRWTGSYPAHIQDSHLAFVREAVVPRLKQPPAAADRLHYILTHNHSPYEASVAFASHKTAKVRFTVQPLVDPSPAVEDPLGQKGLREKLEGLASACGADRTWLEAFVDSVFLTAEEEAGLVEKEANGGAAAGALPRQICYAGFDLGPDEDENGKSVIGMKAYLFPQLQALATGRELVDVTESVVIRLAEGDKAMLAAWELLRAFLVSHGDDKINIYFLAIDCLAPRLGPRFKVYAHTDANSLASARHVFTLGGRLPPSSADFLPQVWPLLMDMEDVPQANMDDLEKPLNKPDSKYCGLCFAFEMAPGRAVPQVKMYVPMWQYARDEAGVVERYERILQMQGMMGNYDFGAGVQDAL